MKTTLEFLTYEKDLLEAVFLELIQNTVCISL